MKSKEYLQSYFHADYRGIESILKDVLEPIFGQADINNQSIIVTPTDKQKAQNTNIIDARHIATLWPIGSDESIKVFDVVIEDRCHIHIARKGIQHLVREWVDRFEGAFIIFHYANPRGRSWRLSYMEKRAKNADSTSAKRYTYLCGQDYPCRTIAERFCQISPDNINSTILEQAFSAEALSDEFFVEYKNFYDDFVNYVTNDDKMFARFKQYAKNDDKLAQKSVRDYIKKLMGRLVFIQFLQKKAWLKNDLYYMQTLFKESTEKQKEDYLDNVLEPLFFGIFNTKEQDRAQLFNDNKWDKTLLAKWADFPYLNGGLFECDDLDELRLPIPSYFFSNPENKDKERKPTDKYYEDACGIFDFFERYNFTIDESDPLDTEVGVDPEMLGKIFENLLEDNKDKGAFYTPKEIVQYMCKESLIAYLVSESQKKNEASKQSQANFEEAIRAFVNDPEMTVTRIARYSEKQLTDMLESLQSVKICDPAIGSGAFPMGLLNLLVNCREALNKALRIGVPRAELKQDIILNNIYGVDIEKGAIDIARLRFWLSIVVDLESPKALPNFDYKFMQGNSLLEQFGGIDLSNLFNSTSTSGKGSGVEMIVFDDTNIKDALLQEKLHTYFSLKEGEDKHRVRQEINNAVKDLLVSKLGTAPTLVDEVKKLDISANDQFFLWHTWFKPVFDQGGFDIVIGNPPYVQLQSNQGTLASLYEKENFKTFTRTGDIYCLFYEQGWKNLCNNGHLCFITSNKWMRAGYGEKTREFFATKTNPKLLIDFAGVKIFASATVDTNILLFEKARNTNSTICCATKKLDKNSVNNLSLFVQQNSSVCSFTSSDSWVILSPIEQSIKQKIEAVGTPLKDWDIQINYGIKTGFNDAFIISTEKRNELLAACKTPDERKRTEELIRPILRGRDIKRYGYDWADLWLINVHNGIKGKIKPININEYPTIKEHLDCYWDKISHRDDQGVTPYNLRNCAYLEDFDKPKIIYNDIAQRLSFALSIKGEYLNNTVYFLTAKNEAILNYLLHILNSKLIDWYYRTLSVQLGEKAVRMFSIYVLKMPIPKNTQTTLAECSDESKIDELVYDIYGLDNDERQVLKDFQYT